MTREFDSDSLVFMLKRTVMAQINYYTEEGLQKLKDELHEMKTVQRPFHFKSDC